MSAQNTGHKQGLSTFATEERPVASGVTVTDGDFVKLLAGGTVTSATIGTGKIYAVVQGSDTTNLVSRTFRNTAVGNAGGTVTVLCELVSDNRYKLPVDAALASDAEGQYYALTGATGVQKVANATKSATVGQLICRKRVADSAGAYTIGIFEVAAPESETTIV